jgi:hypothetical protein
MAGLRTDLDAHRQRLEQGEDKASREQEVADILRRIQSVEQIALGLPDGSDTLTLASAQEVTPGRSPNPAG